MRSHYLLVCTTLLLGAISGAALAQEHAHAAATQTKLGTVHFETSCAAAAQPQFDRAVALLHSFQFGPAIDGFQATLKTDPGCAMAQWGIALSRWGNPFAPGLKPAAFLAQGRSAIEAAKHARTQRERDFVAAAALLYDDYEHTPQPARVNAYSQAMAAVAARYPADTEAAIFYALSLAFSADPADKTYAQQHKAGQILEKLFAQQPEHPGLAHYIIHTYDAPPLAASALTAARRYARIAPDAPHALHMPSHTFTRVGSWQESIDANVAAAAASRRQGQAAEELHASDYQAYAYLQTAQDKAARGILQALPEMESRFDPDSAQAGAAPTPAAFYAIAAIPARYALERGDWAAAARLQARPNRFPYTEAITHFARGLGAARAGDAAAARAEVAALADIRDRLKSAGEPYWTGQVEIQRRNVLAWALLAENHADEALAEMRAAAQLEDGTEKSAVTPGPIAPARELLGDMLFQMKRPTDALREFEATLQKEPNRFRALYGAAHAAQLAGDRADAQKYSAALLKVCERADSPGRAELADARSMADTRKAGN